MLEFVLVRFLGGIFVTVEWLLYVQRKLGILLIKQTILSFRHDILQCYFEFMQGFYFMHVHLLLCLVEFIQYLWYQFLLLIEIKSNIFVTIVYINLAIIF